MELQQIKSWYYNHHPQKQSNLPSIKIVMGAETRPKVLTEAQIYAKTYYPDRVKEQADASASLVAPKYRLDARNKATALALANEDEAVKQEVRRRREEMKKEREEGMRAAQSIFALSEGGRDRTPEEKMR